MRNFNDELLKIFLFKTRSDYYLSPIQKVKGIFNYMKVIIVNGSPKGKYSITLHTCLYIEKKFPENEYKIINIGAEIKKAEKDPAPYINDLKWADLIVFAYPVYTFIVPAQLHRFIEIIKESGTDISGKYATQISTSKHFYDVTAHRFIEDNCADLGLRYIKGLSADMDDLTKEAGRVDAEKFFDYVTYSVNMGLFEPPSASVAASASKTLEYKRSFEEAEKKDGKETVIVADIMEGDNALSDMIEDFRAVYPYPTRVINIREFPFMGGCISCFYCAKDGKCVYKDGFDSFLREKIQTASSIVFAYTVKDHSMGAQFKLYDDRQFCNGHRTVTMGMPMGYIVSGDLSGEENLRTIMNARCEVGHNFLCGMATDADGIYSMSRKMVYALENGYVQPQNFYGVGGMKIFRDLIYIMRGIMVADHKFYKKHGIYDFPQKKKGTLIAMLLVGKLMNNKKLRAKLGSRINEGMVAPYKKVIDKLDKKGEKR